MRKPRKATKQPSDLLDFMNALREVLDLEPIGKRPRDPSLRFITLPPELPFAIASHRTGNKHRSW